MYQEVVEQVQKTVKKQLCQVHTALPGTIESFDPATGLASVTPVGTCTCSNGVSQKFPVISSVPVVFPFSTSAECGIAFPVMSGDPCMIVFSERELDEFISGAESTECLRFDLSNAMVIPGLMKSYVDVIDEAVNENAVVVKCGSTKMIVKEDGVEITGDLKVSGSVSSSS